MMNLVSKLHASREEGQTMAEYAVILGVITIAVVVTLGFLSTAIQDALQAVIDILPTAPPAALARGGLTCPLRPESPARRWRSTRSR